MNPTAHILRYNAAFTQAQKFLNTVGIDFFPFDVFEMPKLLKRFYDLDVIIMPQSDYSAFLRCTGKKPKLFKNGLCVYDPAKDVYLIIYNDTHVITRIRFTIMHEIGHIILEHLGDEATELERGGLPNYKYLRYEGEANTFAGNALAPPVLIQEFLDGKAFSLMGVKNFFRLSEPAVRDYREKDYAAWLGMKHHKYEATLLERCRPKLHMRHCLSCKTTCFGKEVRYCKTCGNKRLSKFWSDDYMKYSAIEVNSDSRALICPCCENESLNAGEYCKVCGTHVVNRCAENQYCGTLADGDARYCQCCGEPTTFSLNGHLVDWKTERGIAPKSDSIAEPPTEDDDNVPF